MNFLNVLFIDGDESFIAMRLCCLYSAINKQNSEHKSTGIKT